MLHCYKITSFNCTKFLNHQPLYRYESRDRDDIFDRVSESTFGSGRGIRDFAQPRTRLRNALQKKHFQIRRRSLHFRPSYVGRGRGGRHSQRGRFSWWEGFLSRKIACTNRWGGSGQWARARRDRDKMSLLVQARCSDSPPLSRSTPVDSTSV